ncbi:MAG TPA: STAS domain-containing protein [Herpetosiphonaceae bacterium]
MHAASQISANAGRRGRLLQYLAIGVACLNLIGIAVELSGLITNSFALLVNLICLAADAVAWQFGRRRRIAPGAALLFASFSALLILTYVAGDRENSTFLAIMPFFVLQIPATALLLDSRSIISTSITMSALWPLVFLVSGVREPAVLVTTAAMLTAATGAVTWLIVRQLETALDDARGQSAELAASRDQLRRQTADLAAREREAIRLQRETASALDALRQASSERDHLARSLQEATLPIMPVSEQVLVLPLVGSIDSQRAALLSSTLLAAIQQARAKAVIVDVTGVPIVDTQVALALLNAAKATLLLGARTVLVGIRPEVAQTLVQLGVNLNAITVRANLQSGIQAALGEIGGA